MRRAMIASIALGLITSGLVTAQGGKPASPRGFAATQVAGSWSSSGERAQYTDGKWIEIDYGRPIKRQRDGLFGEGEAYGERLDAGAPVWRAGANQSTRLATEVDLKFGDQVVPAGEYSLYIELVSPTEWTLIVSNWGAQSSYDPNDKEKLWGAYGYTQDKDVARVPMAVSELPLSIDQLTFGFVNVTQTGGEIGLWWDTTLATAAFSVAN